MVDNYDSFTYNLVHAVEAPGDHEVHVQQRDQLTPSDVARYGGVIFSPGPGLPSESHELMGLVDAAITLGKPLLGVCLGHQALAVHAGAGLRNLGKVHHGVAHRVYVTDPACPLFADLPLEQDGGSLSLTVGRYHSWVVDEAGLPESWRVTCRDTDGEIMAMRHVEHPFYGVQFHPESIMSPAGRQVLRNFLDATIRRGVPPVEA